MRSFKTTLSCLKYTTNWSSMINEFCSHDKTYFDFVWDLSVPGSQW